MTTQVPDRHAPDQSGLRPRLSEKVVVDLAIQILSGRFSPGTRLPTEQELCATYHVSRTVIRDAIAQLRRQELVSVRQGIGTVVLGRAAWKDLDPDLLRIRVKAGLVGDLVHDLLEIRRMVEVEVAGNAARRRTDADLVRLAKLVDQMEAHSSHPISFADYDLQFHDALLAANGNLLLGQIMCNVNQLRRVGSVLNTSLKPENMIASMEGHRAIYEAVKAGDSQMARTAMLEHLLQFEHDISEALTSADPRPLMKVESPGLASR